MPDHIDLVRQQVRHEQEVEEREPTAASPSPRPEKERTWLPDTPDFARNGNTETSSSGSTVEQTSPGGAIQAIAGQVVVASDAASPVAGELLPEGVAGYRAEQNCVNHTEVLVPQGSEEAIRRILGGIGVNLAAVAPGRRSDVGGREGGGVRRAGLVLPTCSMAAG